MKRNRGDKARKKLRLATIRVKLLQSDELSKAAGGGICNASNSCNNTGSILGCG